jgi:hypothetical protein
MKEADRSISSPWVESAESYSRGLQFSAAKSMCRRVAERAAREGVNLNALAGAVLAEGLEWRAGHGD